MRRVMSIWFPDLPLDLRRRMGDARVSGCFGITREVKNARRLTHVSKTAVQNGLHSQMSVADARAIAPDLLTQESNPQREQLLLRAMWRWSDCLSPKAAIDPPDGLFLDIVGCAHLFGGETEMCEYVKDKFFSMYMRSKIAVCDTKTGAWGLARFQPEKTIVAPEGRTRDVLANLPIAALNIKEQTRRQLSRTGLKTIGDLYKFRAGELARRYGLELTQHLSWALGHEPDPVSPQRADPVYSARMTLPSPVGKTDDVESILLRLCESVCTRMRDAQVGARRFDFTVRCVDTGDHVLSAGFAQPCLTPAQVRQQFARPIDELKIECGADWFRLIALHTEPVRPRQIIMGEESTRKKDDKAQVISTIGNKLGFDRVLQFAPHDSHIPEREYALIEAVQKQQKDWPQILRERPERIFARPERLHTLEAGRPPVKFEWRKQAYDLETAIGPERLMPEWWMSGDRRVRDYWVVITKTGRRFWLLTYPAVQPPEWFIAGRFA